MSYKLSTAPLQRCWDYNTTFNNNRGFAKRLSIYMRSPLRKRHTPCTKVLLSRINSPAFSLMFSTSSFRLCFVTSDDARLRNTHTTDNTLILVMGYDVEKRIKFYDLSRIYAFYSLDIPKKNNIWPFDVCISLVCAGFAVVAVFDDEQRTWGKEIFLCCYIGYDMHSMPSVNESLSFAKLFIHVNAWSFGAITS